MLVWHRTAIAVSQGSNSIITIKESLDTFHSLLKISPILIWNVFHVKQDLQDTHNWIKSQKKKKML